MPSRPFPAQPSSRRRSSLVALFALVVGTAVPAAGLLADDGGASGMTDAAKPAESKPAAAAPAKPAAPAAPKGAAKSDAPADERAQRTKDTEMLGDFIHYVLIDRRDLAKSMAQGLIDRNMDPREFMRIVDSPRIGYNRFITAASRAARQGDLADVAGQLMRLYEQGKLGQARDQESIAANIKLLAGDQTQRSVATQRLIYAGEYAVPQLLNTLLGSSDVRLAAQVRQLLVEMRRHSVMPLCAALPGLPPAQQEQVVNILGDGGQTQSLPFLYDLSLSSRNDQVRAAADNAIRKISGAINPGMPLADRYVDLAEQYYKSSPSLISFPNDPHQLVWTFDPGAGLYFQAVDTKAYGPTMAMRLSETALKRDAQSDRAVAAWIASNFAREIRSPEGYEDPVYGKDKREPMYYAVAAGPGIDERVLARALDSGDTPLARKALAALEKTGGRSAWAGRDGRRPLVEALRFPSRRVQYDAALAIASAQPREQFPGSEGVVRTLASAIRDASQKFALVVAGGADTTELQTSYSEALRGAGYTVLAAGTSLDDMRQVIADAPGVDLILVRLPSGQTTQTITAAQSDAKLRATPILAMVDAQGNMENAVRYARDPRVRIAREGLRREDMLAAADELLRTASGGPITGDEAEMYRGRALSALRDVAVANNPVFNLVDAQGPLVAALPEAKGATQARIAEVLSYIPSERAQQAVFDEAMNATGQARVDLLNVAAAGAKRAGNMLAPRQLESLADLVRSASGEEATSAAALMGALNLKGQNVVPLILGDAR